MLATMSGFLSRPRLGARTNVFSKRLRRKRAAHIPGRVAGCTFNHHTTKAGARKTLEILEGCDSRTVRIASAVYPLNPGEIVNVSVQTGYKKVHGDQRDSVVRANQDFKMVSPWVTFLPFFISLKNPARVMRTEEPAGKASVRKTLLVHLVGRGLDEKLFSKSFLKSVVVNTILQSCARRPMVNAHANIRSVYKVNECARPKGGYKLAPSDAWIIHL